MSNPSPSTWENTRHADDGGHDNNNVDNDDDYRRDGDHEVISVYIHEDNDHNDDDGDAKDELVIHSGTPWDNSRQTDDGGHDNSNADKDNDYNKDDLDQNDEDDNDALDE